jgi:hypothetical protein
MRTHRGMEIYLQAFLTSAPDWRSASRYDHFIPKERVFRVHWWEIWVCRLRESNSNFWSSGPQPNQYTGVLMFQFLFPIIIIIIIVVILIKTRISRCHSRATSCVCVCDLILPFETLGRRFDSTFHWLSKQTDNYWLPPSESNTMYVTPSFLDPTRKKRKTRQKDPLTNTTIKFQLMFLCT